MYFGFIKYSENRLESYSNPFSEYFCFGNFGIGYDEPFLKSNRQQLLFENNIGEIVLINNLEIGIAKKYGSFPDFENFLIQNNIYNTISFVYYESSSNSVRIKRDTFGLTTSFYFHKEGKFASFTTSILSLFKCFRSQGAGIINIGHVTRFLDWIGDSDVYERETIFSSIYNVLPGHTTRITSTGTTDEAIQSASNQVYKSESPTQIGENVRELFFDAIKNKISNKDHLACHLSGGLDSSSIAASIHHLWPDISLNTFYIETATDLTDESYYAKLVADQVHSKHNIVIPTENLFEASFLHTKIFGHPDEMTNGASLHQRAIKSALESNCRVVFSGQGGDQILGYGNEFLHDHYRSQNWDILKETFNSPNYQKLLNNTPQSKERELYKTIVSLISGSKGDHSTLHLILNSIRAAKFFEIPISYFIGTALRKASDLLVLPGSLARKELYERTNHISTDLVKAATTVEKQTAIFDKHSITINEQFYLLSFHYGIHHILPFYDADLYHYCNSVPAEVKYDMGRRRGHFREAMRGILPEEVRNRTTKGNFGTYGRHSALLLYNQSRDLLTDKSPVWEYVKKRSFDQSLKLLQQPNKEMYIYNICQFNVFKTINLAIWLEIIK